MSELVPDDPIFKPEFLQELRGSGGVLHKLSHHRVAFTPRSDEGLLVCFGNIGDAEVRENRSPWAEPIAKQLGWSHLANIPLRKDWYRHADMIGLYQHFAQTGFFAPYKRVVFYGASMGGYAALSFSAACPGAHVVAFSPQSTLKTRKVPFEGRFASGVALGDWSQLPWMDAAHTIKHAASVSIVVDPLYREDRKHVRRLMVPTTQVFEARHCGHAAISMLRKMGVVSEISKGLIQGNLSPHDFQRLYRARHTSPLYIRRLLRAAYYKGHVQLVLGCLANLREQDDSIDWGELFRGVLGAQIDGVRFAWPHLGD